MSSTTRSTRPNRPTTPTPTPTPSAPTPVQPDLLAGLMTMRETPRTSRIGQTAVALAAPVAAASAPTAAAPTVKPVRQARALLPVTGAPLMPAKSLGMIGTVPGTSKLQEGSVWAIRRNFGPRTTGIGIGDVACLVLTDPALPTAPGSKIDTWHGNNRQDCGVWEVLATCPETWLHKNVRVNVVGPVANRQLAPEAS